MGISESEPLRDRVRLGALVFAFALTAYLLTSPPTPIAIQTLLTALIALALVPRRVDHEHIRRFLIPAAVLTALVSVALLTLEGYELGENTTILLMCLSFLPLTLGWATGGWVTCLLLSLVGLVTGFYLTSSFLISVFFIFFSLCTAIFAWLLRNHDFDK